MVEDTGKAPCPGAYKPVNTPEPLRVDEDAAGLPLAVKTPRRDAVRSIDDRWRLDDEWWRVAPVSRLYYNVLLVSGQRLIVYKDLAGGGWYQQGE